MKLEPITVKAVGAEKWYYRKKGDANRFFAVEPADLTLEPGKLTVLTGRSGSGKTTLLHMLAGIVTPSGGTVAVNGEDLYAMDDEALSRFRNRHLGIIPQGAELLPYLTVTENILLPAGMWPGADRESAADQAALLLKRLGIENLSGVFARELSGGERRRVSIARALAGTPGVLFADEPTSDLDDENTGTVLELLREYADKGAAVLIVSHDSEALDYADLRLKMDGGRLK